MKTTDRQPLGATVLPDGRCQFLVWAPKVDRLAVRLVAPEERVVPLEPAEDGYFFGVLDGVSPGAQYFYRLNDQDDRPDPASRCQVETVHGPSQVVDLPEINDHPWHGIPLSDYILYELHVGTFSEQGTFDGVIEKLDYLKDVGVTAIELCPVAQFPGRRNWGYDGVYPYAAQNSYGGAEGLARLVEACHARSMAVALDVVYNHMGPEGNYLSQFGHYFTPRYHTPWGEALNFDGPHSDEVRRYFLDNALYWVRDFHIDMLRLDAVHAIYDESARPFLQKLAAAVHEEADRLNRRIWVIEESSKNDPRHIRSLEAGGWGLDGVWMDDFHHCVHTLLTGEEAGYYRDFGMVEQLAKTFREGFVFTGQRSHYRGRRHGESSAGVPASRFVICSQNHDQVGNRMLGERLSEMVSFEKAKLAAGLVLLSPYVPMLFMGEEYGEKAPFNYFVEHSDPGLIEAVRRGRREEFESFAWQGDVPDPQSEETFEKSKLDHNLRSEQPHQTLLDVYRRLIELRKQTPALAQLDMGERHVEEFLDKRTIAVRRETSQGDVCVIYNLSDESSSVRVRLPAGRWMKAFDSADPKWQGPGTTVDEEHQSNGAIDVMLPPSSFVLLVED